MAKGLILLGLAMIVLIAGCSHAYDYYEDNEIGSDGLLTQWNAHQTTLNNDISKINAINAKYSNIQTSSDIDNFVAEINPRYDIYRIHLFEARDFLDANGHLIGNGAELKRSVDESIVELETSINQLNLAIERYDEAVEAQEAEQDAVFSFLQLLVGII